MNRRELIKAIVPAALIPALTVNGETKAAVSLIPPGNYMLFVDPQAIDVDALLEMEPPPGTNVQIVRVFPRPGQNVPDAVTLYRFDEKAV